MLRARHPKLRQKEEGRGGGHLRALSRGSDVQEAAQLIRATMVRPVEAAEPWYGASPNWKTPPSAATSQ